MQRLTIKPFLFHLLNAHWTEDTALSPDCTGNGRAVALLFYLFYFFSPTSGFTGSTLKAEHLPTLPLQLDL